MRQGLGGPFNEERTLGFAVGVASRIRARLRRTAWGAFGLAGSSLPVRQPARSVTRRCLR